MFNGIDEDKINLKTFRITKLKRDILTIYDKYELSFFLKTGEEKRITIYVDKGTVPKDIPDEFRGREEEYQKKYKEFFLKRLFQSNKSESIIYLGSFNYADNSKPINDVSSHVNYNGQSKDDLFKDLIECLELYENGKCTYEDILETFPELANNQASKGSKEPRENAQPNKVNYFKDSLRNAEEHNKTHKTGKHYVLGDIHGYKEPYDVALKMIKPEDSLVLIGDVIDRGPDGIKILQDLMRRKANEPESNITFILGNHEKMMFEALNYILRLKLSPEIISMINQCYNKNRQMNKIYKYHDETGEGDLELAEELKKLCKEIKKDIENSIQKDNINIDQMIKTIGIWECVANGGEKTLQAFMNLNETEQKNIFEFLRTSYIMKQQNIQGKDFLFVHSSPPNDINLVKKLKQSKDGGIKANQIPHDELNFVVWNRDVDTYTPCKQLGLTTVCGHTYEANTTEVNRQKGYIRIDEGCGHGPSCSVGLYCIEDNSVIHIGQDSKAFETYDTGKIKIIDESGKQTIIEECQIPKEQEAR